jgi:hypothetical protein
MNARDRIRWIRKEVVEFRGIELVCEIPCHFDRDRNAYTVIISDHCVKEGELSRLSAAEVEHVTRALRSALGVNRLLGIPIGQRNVYVQHEQRVV